MLNAVCKRLNLNKDKPPPPPPPPDNLVPKDQSIGRLFQQIDLEIFLDIGTKLSTKTKRYLLYFSFCGCVCVQFYEHQFSFHLWFS